VSDPAPPPPSRRDKNRPLHLVGFALAIALFTGVIVLAGSRELMSAVIFTGVAFVAALVLLAMFALIEPGTGEQRPGDEPVLKPKPPRHPD
jgi:heme/copper-type cytochrome/quinol oxidase subunit 4